MLSDKPEYIERRTVVPINTHTYSQKLREKAVNLAKREILIARIGGSEQETDLTEPVNCLGYGRVRHFRMHVSENWSLDPLPIVPAAKALGFPAGNMIRAQVFQNAACNWRCWYCFVPYVLLSANSQHGTFFSAEQLIDLYLEIDVENRPPIIDLSGGQPDLIPEWAYWMMEALVSRGLEHSVFLWADDNLSNHYFWEYLNKQQIEFMVNYRNYARVGCFKGYDAESFAFNTFASPELFEQQFDIYKKLLSEGFDMYAYVTFTTPNVSGYIAKIKSFVDKLQDIHYYLPLRTVPLEIKVFAPTESRTQPIHKNALEFQYRVHDAWRNELLKRFSSNELALAISNVTMKKTFNSNVKT